MTRIALFFYGTRNIVGCCCALAVLALYFTGVIESWWLPLTLGAYAAGWLATPASPEFDFRYMAEINQANLLDALDQLIERSSKRLPADAHAKLLEIRAHAAACLPATDATGPGLASIQTIELTQVLGRDLPETIGNYLTLPATFAQLHPVRDGKTARQLLLEQLELLSTETSTIAGALYSDSADKLAVHGQYLKQKFQAMRFLPE